MNKMDRKAKPVAPIYQPEVPARELLFAGTHHRRQIWVSYSTTQAILANRVAPGLRAKQPQDDERRIVNMAPFFGARNVLRSSETSGSKSLRLKLSTVVHSHHLGDLGQQRSLLIDEHVP